MTSSFYSEFSPDRWLSYPLFHLGDSTLTSLGILKVIFWVGGLFFANAVIRKFFLQRVLARTHFDVGLRFAIVRIFGYVFLTLGFYVALVINGINLNSLAVVAGALGIGVGLGLQNLVSNFVSGLVLLAERPIAIGDRIEIAGVAGDVQKINLRSTVVLTNDNIAIIVPNSELTSQSITNWSHGDPKVRVRVPIGVAYGSNIEGVCAALLTVAQENPHVLKDPAPFVFLVGFGDSSINFELAVWTRDLTHFPRRFRSDLNFAIERAFRAANIEIPFPQRVVHLKQQ